LEGERFVLTGPEGTVVTVGRSPESDLFLDDVTVSRKHAEFRHGSTGWSVCDVGSLNGTYVNRERIDDVTLASDAEVQIGKYRFTYLTAPGIGS
jgi:pSer/pThr/pTyr-binding forkhead associated (FHA) protein